MATPDDFRRLALSFPGTEEKSHMGHPDFRVRGKIFATLGSPDLGWAMVKVSPDQQALLLEAEPEAFKPAAGTWGRQGSTLVRLDLVAKLLDFALFSAWHDRASSQLRQTYWESNN